MKLMPVFWPGFVGYLSVDGTYPPDVPGIDCQRKNETDLVIAARLAIAAGVDHRRLGICDRWSQSCGYVGPDGSLIAHVEE